MYQLSRSIYRELAPEILPDPIPPGPHPVFSTRYLVPGVKNFVLSTERVLMQKMGFADSIWS